nr:MAG TPA: Membrane-attachment and polymerization-promoting switch [Caudoviricetes sp.]
MFVGLIKNISPVYYTKSKVFDRAKGLFSSHFSAILPT